MERALSTMQCLKSRDQQHPTWGGVGVELGGEQRPQRQTPEWKSMWLGRSMTVAPQSPRPMWGIKCNVQCLGKIARRPFDQALLQNSSGRVPEHIWWPKAVYITLVASRHSYCGLKSCKGVQWTWLLHCCTCWGRYSKFNSKRGLAVAFPMPTSNGRWIDSRMKRYLMVVTWLWPEAQLSSVV